MQEIKLTQGKVALVDDEDFTHLNLFKWYAKWSGVCWYAVRMKNENRHSMRGLKKGAKSRIKRKRTTIRMHRVIMNTPNDMVVHHEDSNGLHNYRSNLENCTPLKNIQNVNEKRTGVYEDNIPF